MASDVILLPYDSAIYAARTSGIFCEAISAGKLTVVIDGIWIASELRRHKLDELIIDRHGDNLAERVFQLHEDAEVRRKIVEMQMAYRALHNTHGFTSALECVYQEIGGRLSSGSSA